ncbi:MAG: hypothetical protein WCP21_06820, partial [Armatimonadota bacterium]
MTAPLQPKIAVASLCSPLEVGADQAPAALSALANLLRDAGCEVVNLGPADTPDRAATAGRACAEQHVDAIACVAVS